MTWRNNQHPDSSPAWFLSVVVFSGDKFSPYVILRPYSDFPGNPEPGQEYALCIIHCSGILISKTVPSFSGSVSAWLLLHLVHLCLISSHVYAANWKLGPRAWVITKYGRSRIHLRCRCVLFGILKGDTCHAVLPWLKITLCDSTGSSSKTSYQVTAIPTAMCLGIMGLDRTGLYRSFSTVAVFWASLSGVTNGLPRFLLHTEVILFVSNMFSEWHYVTAFQMSKFSSFILLMVSPISQSCLNWYWLETLRRRLTQRLPSFLRLTSCCILSTPGLGSFPQLTPWKPVCTEETGNALPINHQLSQREIC